MKIFLDKIREESKTGAYPIHFVRFEDLILQKQETLERIMKFLLKVNDIEGTIA